MTIFAPPIEKLVKQEFVQHVQTTLSRDMFWNLRLALVGAVGALLLYYVMLVSDSNFQKHLTWFLIEAFVVLPVAIFQFFGENWIKDIKKRTVAVNAMLFVASAVVGTAFCFQWPEMKNPNMKLTTFSLIIGVVSAAAFTMACNRFTFIVFSIPWLMPITFYFAIFVGDVASIMLSSMAIPLLGVLTFLCLKDYERRVFLINSELTVLEEKEQVITASKKLKESLDLVNELKTQQDGDYYLTSLLLNPLGVNAVDEAFNVDVDFFTKQKKYFEFKHHKKSIGGDISIAHTVTFSNGPATIFLNGDAMGKSMQGAGGALVLGAVFQSIIERSRIGTKVEPAEWLKATFLELQKVFESFDCSMLVSIYIGVLENNTGMLHYLNAEHPWGVLYRDSKAVFLQNRSYYRKLGTPGLQDEITLDHLQLQPGDVILLGSDGRDDVVLPDQKSSVRVINEDESLFLKHVEITDGRLVKIYEMITALGEITDDLSLLRVEYRAPRQAVVTTTDKQTASNLLRDAKQLVEMGSHGEASQLLRQAVNSESAGPRALRAALNLSMQIKEYSLASIAADKILKLHVGDLEVLHIAAFASRRLNHLDKAKHFAEKLKDLESAPNVLNLLLLAEIYAASAEPDRAHSMLDEVLTIDPFNARAKKLREEFSIIHAP